MKTFSLIAGPLVSLALVSLVTHGEEARSDNPPPTMSPVAHGGATALASTLARADEAALRSTVRPNSLKGNFGEAHMGLHLPKYLQHVGNWQPLPVRFGPQGIDGLFIRYDASGSPDALIVSEAKFKSSSLGKTKDGIQMGLDWRSPRLARIARELRSIVEAIESNKMSILGVGDRGSVGKQRLQIPLPSGKAAVFTRAALSLIP